MRIVTAAAVAVVLVVIGFFMAVRIQPEMLERGSWEPAATGGAAVGVLADLGDGRMLAGLQAREGRGGGIAVSADFGRSWSAAAGLPDELAVHDLVVVGPGRDVVLAACFRAGEAGGVLRSPDGGRTWEACNTGLPDPDVRCLAVLPGEPPVVLAGTVNRGVYLSTDQGRSWSERNQGLEAAPEIQDLAVAPGEPDLAYAATLRGLYRTTDAGANWHRLAIEPSTEAPFVLQVGLDRGGGRLFILDRSVSARTRAFVSLDRGQTWSELGRAGTPEEFHPRCLLAGSGSPGMIFLGTVHDGVLASFDGGQSWRPMNGGLPVRDHNIIVHDLAEVHESQPGGPVLLAATDLAGRIYRTPLSVSWPVRLAEWARGL